MNLVFGSVFLFLILSPGLIFRFSYLQGTYSKLNFRVSAVEELFWALVPAMFIQLSALLIVEYFLNYTVRLDVVYQLITGSPQKDFAIIKASLLPFLLYTLFLIIISVVAGVLTRSLVRMLRLDMRIQFLRFRNEWHYLLSGEIFNAKNYDATPGTIIMIQVDVLADSSEGNVIYSGQLEDYFLTRDNSLDRIYLTNVYRRRLKDDLDADTPNPGFLARDMDERYYRMPGYIFVIPSDKILNLNITYYIDELEEDIHADESSAE
jgi:hypothetical protein